MDALMGCGTTNIPEPEEAEGKETGKCGCEGGEAELEDSGLWEAA